MHGDLEAACWASIDGIKQVGLKDPFRNGIKSHNKVPNLEECTKMTFTRATWKILHQVQKTNCRVLHGTDGA